MASAKISDVSAVSLPIDTTDLLPLATSAGVSQAKITIAQVRGDAVFRALDYGTNGAAIQSAVDAAVAAGGGEVYVGPGTWALGATSLSIGGSNVRIRGAGKGATTLTYTGSAGAIVNSATGTTRYFCGVSDMAIDITGASAGAKCLHVFNFYRGEWERLDLKAGTTTFDCLTLEATGGASTYYNRFQDVDASTSGICIHFTGSGAINRNSFINGLLAGNGKAIVSDCTASTNDTTMFQNLAVNCLATPTVVQLGGSGGAVRFWTFLNTLVESSTGDWVCATASGTAAGCVWLGGYLGNTHVVTQDNLANFVLVPSLGGLDFSQFSGTGTAADALWFARDNGGATFGSGKDTNLYRGGSNLLQSDDSIALPTGFVQLGEISTPATPGANLLKVYGRDTGGVTQLAFMTSDGVARVIGPTSRAVEFVIDGGGSAITTGVKGDIELPFSGVIERVTMLADQSGSITLDLWKDTYANYPPTVADTIVASAHPLISAATKSQDSTLTGWTTAVTKGDVLRVNVDSASTVTRVLMSLLIREG